MGKISQKDVTGMQDIIIYMVIWQTLECCHGPSTSQIPWSVYNPLSRLFKLVDFFFFLHYSMGLAFTIFCTSLGGIKKAIKQLCLCTWVLKLAYNICTSHCCLNDKVKECKLKLSVGGLSLQYLWTDWPSSPVYNYTEIVRKTEELVTTPTFLI